MSAYVDGTHVLGLGALGAATEGVTVSVDQPSLAFIERAQAAIASIRTRAEKIGPAPWFAGDSYYGQWDPVIDDLTALYNEGRDVLDQGSPEFATFRDSMVALNKAVAKLRMDASGTVYKAAIDLLMGNPFTLMRAVGRQVAGLPGVVSDAGTAAKQLYVNPFTGFWDKYGAYVKWGGIGAVGLAIANALGLLRSK